MDEIALKILIVDDDEGDRKQFSRAIRQSGMSAVCTETASIVAALAACADVSFDCAIVDYRLPGEDGLEGITALRKALPNLAIIMSTGQGDEMVATEAMKRGAADYVSKSRINGATVQYALQNALQKSALQRKVNQQQEELENFARVLVHDLRAPAGAVETFAGRIAEMLEMGNQVKAREYADWVVQRAQRMNRLIDTLQQYTTADARVSFEPVSLARALDEALANLQKVLQESGAHITAANLPEVVGNFPQLIQLLQNLIGNAVKYCDRTTPEIHLSATRKDTHLWLIAIKDNGIGIAEAHTRRIFDPFIRVGAQSKREGTGLGLATCRKIVERHGGHIWCESRMGASSESGTTFFFTLPAVPAASDDAHNLAVPGLASDAVQPAPLSA